MTKQVIGKREAKGSSGIAVTGFILGIISLLLAFSGAGSALLFALPAVVLGFTSLNTSKRWCAVTAIVLGVLAILVIIIAALQAAGSY